MKGTYLGEFQEIVMLAILLLQENAYGVTIQAEISSRVERKVSRGALHAALIRLEDKGFVQSHFGGATAVRGGRRKKYYTVSESGKQAVERARQVREGMWQSIPKLST